MPSFLIRRFLNARAASRASRTVRLLLVSQNETRRSDADLISLSYFPYLACLSVCSTSRKKMVAPGIRKIVGLSYLIIRGALSPCPRRTPPLERSSSFDLPCRKYGRCTPSQPLVPSSTACKWVLARDGCVSTSVAADERGCCPSQAQLDGGGGHGRAERRLGAG